MTVNELTAVSLNTIWLIVVFFEKLNTDVKRESTAPNMQTCDPEAVALPSLQFPATLHLSEVPPVHSCEEGSASVTVFFTRTM
ncbi:MAG: hypothetical protein IJI36_02785, partial [Kiritimatiellae bacterium]|nr:hypothetical protein [Kiritimatiellia bacterium]